MPGSPNEERHDARVTDRLSVDDDRVFAELSDSAWQRRVRALGRDPLDARDTVTRDHMRDALLELLELLVPGGGRAATGSAAPASGARASARRAGRR